MKVGREKELKCKYCGEMFQGKVQLFKHKVNAHQGEEGELCSICGKSFFEKGTMKAHIGSVHGGKKL